MYVYMQGWNRYRLVWVEMDFYRKKQRFIAPSCTDNKNCCYVVNKIVDMLSGLMYGDDTTAFLKINIKTLNFGLKT